MPLRVNNNIIALNTRRQLLINNRELAKRVERLSSGLRINRAADDAAGLSVSESMRAELAGNRQAARNAEHGINLIQTAEGALNEVSAMLIRMRELAVQSASSTINDANREALNAELVQLVAEIDRIASSTSYNDTILLTGFGNTISQNTAAIATAPIKAPRKPFVRSPLTKLPASIRTRAAMIRLTMIPNNAMSIPSSPSTQVSTWLITAMTSAAMNAGPKPSTSIPIPNFPTIQMITADNNAPISIPKINPTISTRFLLLSYGDMKKLLPILLYIALTL